MDPANKCFGADDGSLVVYDGLQVGDNLPVFDGRFQLRGYFLIPEYLVAHIVVVDGDMHVELVLNGGEGQVGSVEHDGYVDTGIGYVVYAHMHQNVLVNRSVRNDELRKSLFDDV